MRFFLEQLADYHLQKYLTDISEFCFVFPSRRAGVFFSSIPERQDSKAGFFA